MIRILIKSKDDQFSKISILGHAMYDDYGKDIVCSAASAIVITTVNGIYRVNQNYLSIEKKDDGLVILIPKDDDLILHQLLLNMIDLLKQLSNDYPKNVEIK